MTGKNILKLLVVIGIVFIIIFGINFATKVKYSKQTKAVLITGLPQNQNGVINEMAKVSEEYQYIEKGNNYLKENRIKEAIGQYEIGVAKARTSSMRDLAKIRLVDAYEKSKDYGVASKLLGEMISGYKVPEGHPFRIPDEQRFLYLQYAANGEYDLAVEHAQKAHEADSVLPNHPKSGTEDYIQRLNDLKAAKNYITSLKKN